jgi:two-component system, NarL family, response regulator NreC
MGIRILVAETRGVGREGLCHLLAAQEDIEIAGEADDGAGAIPLAANLSPDVIIISVTMRNGDGIDATRQILGGNPAIRIVGMSTDLDVHGIREFLGVGGAGFVTRANSISEFLRAIRSVVAKRIYLSPDVADAMVASYILRPPSDRNTRPEMLSLRERDVLRLVAKGMTTKEAASTLKISAKTVDMHRQRIMAKLKIHGVAELTKYAIREGIAALH